MSTIHAANYGDGTNTVPASAVLRGTAKAWINFGSITTTTIRDDANVSSLTDNGVGDTSINFTSAVATANYASVNSSEGTGASDSLVIFSSITRGNTTALAKTLTQNSSGSATDVHQVNFSAFGDLA